jgi:lipoprotein-releasing system permease protein
MRASFPLALGLRILRGRTGSGRHLRGSVLAIALSLVPLLVVMEVSTGLIEGITARLIEVGTYHIQVFLPSSTGPDELAHYADAAMGTSPVVEVIPERQGTGLLASSGASAGITVRFVPPGLISGSPGMRKYFRIASGTAELGEGRILVGSAVADRLGAAVGDRLVLLTPFSENGQGPPRLTPVTVGGIFDTGYQELDKLYAYAALPASWSMVSPRASRTLLGVKVKDPFGDVAGAARALRRVLPVEARVYTWRELEYARLRSFQTTKALLLVIMGMIVLVAGVNLSSAVIMIAFERRMEIGILKSVGAGPWPLSMAFLAAGLVTGFLGTAAGLALGLLAAVNINELIAALQWLVNAALAAYSAARAGLAPGTPPVPPFTLFNSAYYLSTIPIRIGWVETGLAAAFSIALSGIASYLPASRAARARPLDVIRKV